METQQNNQMTDSQIIELHDKLREKKSKDYTDQEVQYQKFFFAWGINCKEFRKKFCNKR